jgi:hypothetical protein
MKNSLVTTLLLVFLAVFLIPVLGIGLSAQTITCRRPSFLTRNYCRQMEARLLDTTVRVVVQSWQVNPAESGYRVQESVGYATVQDGRYLVTHNHFSMLCTPQLAPATAETFTRLIFYDADGEFILAAPLTNFAVAVEATETLVIEMKDESNRKAFASQGVTSAHFEANHFFLVPGTEVAQVDWNGAKASINWVLIQKVVTATDAPYLLLGNGVIAGASGGGVFWNGSHVATNWGLVQCPGENRTPMQQFTIAVLDSREVRMGNRP